MMFVNVVVDSFHPAISYISSAEIDLFRLKQRSCQILRRFPHAEGAEGKAGTESVRSS